VAAFERRGLPDSAVPIAFVRVAGLLYSEGAAATRHPVRALVRARALQAVVENKEPWLEKAKTVAKRLAGISRQAKPVLHDASELASSKKRDDEAIVRLVLELDTLTEALVTEESVRSALVTMEKVATELDRIFPRR
jgi:glycyl-tRNA synthetase beta chain